MIGYIFKKSGNLCSNQSDLKSQLNIKPNLTLLSQELEFDLDNSTFTNFTDKPDRKTTQEHKEETNIGINFLK